MTPATVASFSLSLEADAWYEFDLLLLVESAATNTSPRFVLNGPAAETTEIHYEVTGIAATNAQYTAWGSSISNAVNAPVANTTYAIRITGVVLTSATTPATDVTLQLSSETASTAVTLKAGSLMRFRKIN